METEGFSAFTSRDWIIIPWFGNGISRLVGVALKADRICPLTSPLFLVPYS